MKPAFRFVLVLISLLLSPVDLRRSQSACHRRGPGARSLFVRQQVAQNERILFHLHDLPRRSSAAVEAVAALHDRVAALYDRVVVHSASARNPRGRCARRREKRGLLLLADLLLEVEVLY